MTFLTCEDETQIIPEVKIKNITSRFLQAYPLTFQVDILSGTGGDDFEFIWEYGDGNVGSGLEVTHAYDTPGNYEIKLTITGKTDSKSDSRNIEVQPSLQLLESYDVRVDEPSGLSFGSNNGTLWTVSDRTGKVVQVGLEGEIIRTLDYRGSDLEGVSFDRRDSTLWLVDESAALLIHLDSNGIVLQSKTISSVSDGSGLEGITLDLFNDRIFLLKEKDISALLILDDSLQTRTYTRIGFAPDFSGMDYSRSIDRLWLLSHEASSVYLADTTGGLIASYGVDLAQPEGLVFDEIDSIFYIVDDASDKLYKYGFWE